MRTVLLDGMKFPLMFLCFAVSCMVCYGNEDYRKEYELLYKDLLYYKEPGYKTYFNNQTYKSDGSIQFSQGSLISTDMPLHAAISGEGFFKIALDDGKVGYTRRGDFKIDFERGLITGDGYLIFDSIYIDNSVYYPGIEIGMDGTISSTTFDGKKQDLGRLQIYNVPEERLVHYDKSIYVLNDDSSEETHPDSRIVSGFLEMGNVEILPVLLRMNFLLHQLDENECRNLEIKREYCKLLIQEFTRAMESRETDFRLRNVTSRLLDISDELEIINRDYYEALEDKTSGKTITLDSLSGLFSLEISNFKKSVSRFNKNPDIPYWEIMRVYVLDCYVPFLSLEY